MPRTTGRGFASVKPHWMMIKHTPTIPSQSPASSDTPRIPQRGAVGSRSSRPNFYAPPPTETHIFQTFASGLSLDYKGSLPGRVETHGFDEDDIEGSGASTQTVDDFVQLTPVSVQTTTNLSWRMPSNAAALSASSKPTVAVPTLQMQSMPKMPETHLPDVQPEDDDSYYARLQKKNGGE